MDTPRYTPGEAMWLLMQGDARFRTDTAIHPHQKISEWKAKSAEDKTQHPYAVILSCADSRVSPEILFDCGLGDIFVLRVAGNIYDDDIFGSIVYAVEYLQVPLVLVLGHERCGAVAAAQTMIAAGTHAKARLEQSSNALHTLVAKLWDSTLEARQDDVDQWLNNAVRNNVMAVTRQVREGFARLQRAASINAFAHVLVIGARYDLDTGELELLDQQFKPSLPAEGEPVRVHFRNQSGSTVIIYWNTYEGMLRLTLALEPGQERSELAYPGHMYTFYHELTPLGVSYNVTTAPEQEYVIYAVSGA